MIWHVWTDGSCLHSPDREERAAVPPGGRGFGGWAAIVEHGHDGTVLRGRERETTNVRMELRAAIEGLTSVPAGGHVVLHTDATTLVSIHVRWLDGRLGQGRRVDGDLWALVGEQFDRLTVAIDLLGRGPRDPVHRRAHGIAGAEARAGFANMPLNAAPLEDAYLLRKNRRSSAARLAAGFRGELR